MRASPAVQARRRAAWAINRLCREANLANLSMHFDGDTAEEWVVVNPDTEVRALKHGRLVAEVFFEGDTARIVIEDIYQVIRSEHLSEFDPLTHGFEQNTARDFLGERLRPDFEGRVPLGTIPLLDAPERPVARTAAKRAIIVEGSLG